MNIINSYSLLLIEFLESGGYVLYAIFATALLIWFLIGERYWYFLFEEQEIVKRMVAEWQALKAENPQTMKAIRACRISQFRQSARKYLLFIKSLTNISVLLGLLGTITGMIRLFEGLGVTQGSSVRVLADGVSQTVIPALAGLVVAISGVYFSARLEDRAAKKIHNIADRLTLPS